MKHTLVALVQNHPGVLNRVAGLFRRRSFNIESIAVGEAEISGMSRMTIVVEGDNSNIEQVRKQLDKLIEVVKVADITNEEIVARELALIKVKAGPQTRSEIIQIVDVFRANIIDVSPESLVIEVTGDGNKVESLLTLLSGFGIREVNRTGRVAMTRGAAGPLLTEEEVKTARIAKGEADIAAGSADW